MKVFFTGATGVLGRLAVPILVGAGHTVTAVSRSRRDSTWLRRVGAHPVEVDLFNPEAVTAAVHGNDAVVHFATAIPSGEVMGEREAWAVNDRLRSEAARLLVDAAITNGVSRFIQQSITFIYADGGDRWLDETSDVDPIWDVLDSAVAAEAQVDRFVDRGGTGVVLRLSRLYGPGRASADYVAGVTAGAIPVLGSGNNHVSHIHRDDAASGLLAALAVPGGTYNVTDDVPVTATAALECLAETLGAPTPPRFPAPTESEKSGLIGLLTISHRVSNRKLKEASGWRPEYPSVIEGWPTVVA